MRFGSVLPFKYAEEGRVLRAALYSHKSVDFPKKGSGNWEEKLLSLYFVPEKIIKNPNY